MIYPIVFLIILFSMPVGIIAAERAAHKRRVRKARAVFAEAYNAMKRAELDCFTGHVPALHESAEKAGWNLAYLKSRA